MNDIVLELNDTIEFDMFADDSTLYTSANSVDELNKSLSTNSNQISTLIKHNSMVLNIDKTECMIFGTKPKCKKNIDKFNITMCNKRITSVKSHKLVGLHLDNYLQWDIHIENLCKKIKCKLFLFNKIKHYLPHFARIQFYDCMVQSVIDYGCSTWGNCNKTLQTRIHGLIKRFGRSLLNIKKPTDSKTVAMFKQLDWLPLNERIKYIQAGIMWKIMNNQAPNYLSTKFTQINMMHDRNTRQSQRQLIYLPKCNNEYGKRTFSYSGGNIWNSLPDFVKQSGSIDTFKKNYLRYTKVFIYNVDSFFLDS